MRNIKRMQRQRLSGYVWNSLKNRAGTQLYWICVRSMGTVYTECTSHVTYKKKCTSKRDTITGRMSSHVHGDISNEKTSIAKN